MDKLSVANKIIDKIFDEGFETFGKKVSALKKVDDILLAEKEILPKPVSMDKTYMDIVGRPYDNPNQFRFKSDNIEVEFDDETIGEDWPYGMGEPIEDDVPPDDTYDDMGEEEPAENEDPKKVQNKLNNVPDQSLIAMRNALRKEFGGKPTMESSDAYKKHFRRMMKKWGIKDPADLGSDAKKKEFFNAVDRSWKAENE